ncbi:MAG: DUF6623 family protein [Nitrososphaerota archaeon]
MLVIKSFIHGNAVVPEIFGPGAGPFLQIQGCPWSEFLGLCSGYGRTFRGAPGKSTWFHASIPTQPVIEVGRIQLDKIYLFFSTGQGCFLTEVHVWDGPIQVQRIPGINTTGDHSRNPTNNANSWQTRPGGNIHTMNYGLGISMRFRFDADSTVSFASIGADFILAS